MNKLITGRTHYYAPAANIGMVVTITGAPTQNQVKTAILKALNKHEMFSQKVTIDKNGNAVIIQLHLES